MIEIKRPVFFSGENPCLTLITPDPEQTSAIASYWHCTDSPWGVGHVLILWLAKPVHGLPGGIFTDHLELADALVLQLSRHFPEFEGISITALPTLDAHCVHSFDGEQYRVLCQTLETRIELEWTTPLDRKQVNWQQFPAGAKAFDLTTVIRPCQSGSIRVNGSPIPGNVKTSQSPEGYISSTAFLAFAETWIGPLEKIESGG